MNWRAKAETLEMKTAKSFVAADKEFVWHPFTQMLDWLRPEYEPLMLVRGQGAWVFDADGRNYLDGNSSIWTNIHGHNHPSINQAIRNQLGRVAHTSFLGLGNPLAARLAEELVNLVDPARLRRVFFSDDGSTAIEVAIKMCLQYFFQNGFPKKKRLVAFSNAYHGDTMGASSLGGIPAFHARFAPWHFPVQHIAAATDLLALDPSEIAAVVIEPLIQGAAGMRLWPPGLLGKLRSWCDQHKVFLIFDEVMTGFGRTGKMFAFQHESVAPDFLALAKGLTGGYLPLGATLTTEKIFQGFLGGTERTFFYGHSYAGNQLGCAAALANLDVFRAEGTLDGLLPKIRRLADGLERIGLSRFVRATRQCGFIAGVELGKPDGTAFLPEKQIGALICQRARAHQLLTRPIGDVIVLMLPLCATEEEIALAESALSTAIEEVCGTGHSGPGTRDLGPVTST